MESLMKNQDRRLMAEAWRDLKRHRRTGPDDGKLYARRDGLCTRCGKPILRGQAVREHPNFHGLVHHGCRDAEREIEDIPTVTGARQPARCPHCFLEHSGECP